MDDTQDNLKSKDFKKWYYKQGYAVYKLQNKQKWVQSEIYGCYNRLLDDKKFIGKNIKQEEIVQLTTSLDGQQLTNPFRSFDCNYGSCIFNESQLRSLLQHQFHRQYNSIKLQFSKFICPICKQKTSSDNQGNPKQKRLKYLYFDNQLLLYIDMARQIYLKIIEDLKIAAENLRDQKEKNNQFKKIEYLEKRFKRSYLKIYRNGRVDLYYNDNTGDRAPFKVYNLFPPSKIETQIYYNPTDRYNRRIKNKDYLKIVQNLLNHGAIQQIKSTISNIESYGASEIYLQKLINQANEIICQTFEKNITFVDAKQKQKYDPLVQIIKPEGVNMKYLLLQIFDPYQRTWNKFQIKRLKKFDMLSIMEPTTQIYTKNNSVFLVSPSSLYRIYLNSKINKYQQELLEYVQKITDFQNQQRNFGEKTVSQTVMKSKDNIVASLFAYKKPNLENQIKIDMQGITLYNNCLYFFGGRILQQNPDLLSYQVKSLSKAIYCLDLKKKNQSWRTVRTQLPIPIHSPTIIQDGPRVFIIGGQLIGSTWKFPKYSQNIIQFDLQTETIVSQTPIQTYQYQSTYFVTKSVQQDEYKLISCRQNSQNEDKIVNGLVFDKNIKTISGSFQLQNNFMKLVTQKTKGNICTYFNYPSVCTHLNDINYAIVPSLTNPKERKLMYGSDQVWLLSNIQNTLI